VLFRSTHFQPLPWYSRRTSASSHSLINWH